MTPRETAGALAVAAGCAFGEVNLRRKAFFAASLPCISSNPQGGMS